MKTVSNPAATLQKSEKGVSVGIRRVCLLGHEPGTVRAIGQLLGRDYYLVVLEDVDGFLSVLHSQVRLDGLVLDIQSADPEAVKLLETLRSEGMRLPLFIFTSSDDPSISQRADNLGVRGFFRKPGEILRLGEALHKEFGPVRQGPAAPGIPAGAEQIVGRAIRYIEESLLDISSSTNVSRYLGVTREHLSRQFTKYTGHTLWDFITMCRVEKAKELLREKGLLVKQISREVGFNCESSFFRAFTRHTGLTPERYRKRFED